MYYFVSFETSINAHFKQKILVFILLFRQIASIKSQIKPFIKLKSVL